MLLALDSRHSGRNAPFLRNLLMKKEWIKDDARQLAAVSAFDFLHCFDAVGSVTGSTTDL